MKAFVIFIIHATNAYLLKALKKNKIKSCGTIFAVFFFFNIYAYSKLYKIYSIKYVKELSSYFVVSVSNIWKVFHENLLKKYYLQL